MLFLFRRLALAFNLVVLLALATKASPYTYVTRSEFTYTVTYVSESSREQRTGEAFTFAEDAEEQHEKELMGQC